VDNTIDYMDQASFLGLRALGHGPVIQWIWIYSHEVDLDGLRRFHRNLGRGLLGRRIEVSPLPFGRHRWVADSGPGDIEIAPVAIPRAEVADWLGRQSLLPIDPEHGPVFRLSVQPITEGGAAVTLVASHTVVDGVGLVIAVTEAAGGVTRDLPYPPPGTRTKRQARQEDWLAFRRSVPEMARSVLAAIRVARNNRGELSPGKAPGVDRSAPGGNADEGVVVVPAVTVHVGIEQWDRRSQELGGTPNSLFHGFTTRLGYNLGWLTSDGSVKLSVPVNDRKPAQDNRGNALTGVTMTADPHQVTTDLTGVRASLKAALAGLGEARNELLAPLPLTPLVPKGAARRLEGLVRGDRVVGSSNVSDMDPLANRPDGTDAEWFAARMAERLTRADLRRSGGVFFPVVSGRINGRVYLSIGFADADASTTREQLKGAAEKTLADVGLSGTVE